MTRTVPPLEHLTPACDRCGHSTPAAYLAHDAEPYLTHDGMGLVCPRCRVGAAEVRSPVEEIDARQPYEVVTRVSQHRSNENTGENA